MSRIFKISGNFVQNGEWAKPDPSFTGKIVVDDNNEFYGYCDELYSSSMSEINRIRYLSGVFATNIESGQRGIAFYKMSNDRKQAPLMYVVPDLTDPEGGTWAALTEFGYFLEMGKSKITVEEEPFSEEEEKNIKAKYDNLDENVNHNKDLLTEDQIACTKSIIIHGIPSN